MNPLFIVCSPAAGYNVTYRETMIGVAIMVGSMSFRRLRTSSAVALALAALGVAPGWAGDGHDHDRARQAVEAGEVLPLKMIMERVERDYPGKVMEVELERHGERWIYEIKLLRAGGALVKVKIDGRTGEVIDATERRKTEGRPHANSGG
jgi:uncharacterized membrane protein YkoI